MLFLSVTAFGQKQKEVTFDFSNPSYLNLSGDGDINLNSSEFTKGQIKMSFDRLPNSFGVYYNNNNKDYNLQILRGGRVLLTGMNEAAIQSVSFTFSTFGDFSVVDKETGKWDSNKGIWNCDGDNNVQSVMFKNSGDQSLIKAVKVTYIEIAEILEPTVESSQLKVSSFKDLTLKFASDMTQKGTSELTIEGPDGSSQPLLVNVDKSVIKLSVDKAIATEGTYTVKVPAGYFVDKDGYSNKALTYTIVVDTPKNILNFESVNPVQGEIDKLVNPITLYYAESIKDFTAELIMKKDGVDQVPVTLKRNETNSKEVNISFDVPEGITEKGIYTIEVPEKTITDQLGKLYNPAFVLTYKVGYIPESETMKKAKALLTQKGIGYPAVDSESRIALEGLTTAAEIPSDEDLAMAIDNFYKETKVELPAAGKWYYISNLSPAGKSLYLKIGANGTVGVTENKADATAFEVAEPMLFKTIEGKYLFPATELQDDAADKELKLEKLAITGLDITKQMGLLNLYGYFDTTKTGKVLNAYLAVDHDKKALVTDDHDSAPTFTETYSTAIQFVETVKPLKMIDMKCTAKPTIISDGMDELTLTFDEKERLQMAEGTVVKLCQEDGTEIETLNVTVDAKKANVIHVNVASVKNGKYLIAFPEGALSYKESGIVYKNNKVNVEIEVAKSIPFNYTYTGLFYSPTSVYIKDVDLNNFTIGNSHYNYPEKPKGLVVDESKEVELRQVDSDKLIRKGHFKRVASMPGIPDCPEAYQIEFDTPILEGELKPNNYTFVFKAATYGDYNFGKYLQGAASPQECYVNAESTVTLTVDNDKATGISNVTVDGTKNAIIYDIYGRKVTKINQPGIYIVNGKKVIKK